MSDDEYCSATAMREALDEIQRLSAAQADLRDQFAIIAMAGLMSRGHFAADVDAKLAYQYADAMMRAREKGDD